MERSRKMTQRQQVIAGHRLEGEPQTMARVQGMCEERWPHRSAIQWIESTATGPRRHVAVTFARDRIEGSASTWLEAMDRVDTERQRRGIGY
jgi:hypothetical protein